MQFTCQWSDYRIVHFLGGGAAPRHTNRYHRRFEFGEKSCFNAVGHQQAGSQHDKHQKIGRNAMAGKSADNSFHGTIRTGEVSTKMGS